MTKQERLKEVYNFLRINGFCKSQKDLARIIGYRETSVSKAFSGQKDYLTDNFLISLNNSFNNIFSIPWLLQGYGEMLETSTIEITPLSINQTGNNNVAGNHNKVTYGNVERAKVVEADTAPIVPTALARKPNFDVLPFLSKNPEGVEMSSVNVKYTEIAMWYRVQDDSLSPNYLSGDLLGLQSYPQGQENPIPGKLYAVDTVSNGIVVRLLYPCEGGYVARAYNEEKYPEFVITKEDIIRIYRTIVMVRF